MNILFVSSGNTPTGVSPLVKNQGDSLKKSGINIEYFNILGKGALGYLKNIFRLKKVLKKNKFDIVHAHYTLSGYVASLAGARPLVVSLMGSDVQKGILGLWIIKLFNKIFWKLLIVKSKKMKSKIKIRKCHVIPNGVDFKVFKPTDKKTAQGKVGFNSKKHIIFVANPDRKEKNYRLAVQAHELLNDPDVELNVVSGISHDIIPYYYHAADVLLLTSLWEGSPNVVKEAMACNLPIVSTDVGDVREVIGDTEGCYVASFNPDDVADKLKLAFQFGQRTNGREEIKYLDSNVIAKKIISLYGEVLDKKEWDFKF